MGFFSSRKAVPTPPAAERTTVQAIRSRFYGNAKSVGKASPAPSAASPPAARVPEVHPSNQSLSSLGRPLSTNALTYASSAPASPLRTIPGMTLAQRLNELATANADGLLDDDEHRLLRQNLFERFATDPDPKPLAKPPVVPSSNESPNHIHSPHSSRPPSVNSQRSISTAVSSIFRRKTSRAAPSLTVSTSASVISWQQQMSPTLDSVSVMSRPSVSSRSPRAAGYPNGLSRRPSDESLMSSSQAGSASASLTADLRVMSRRNIVGSTSYASSISSRATARSAKPPSSFHLRHPTLRNQRFSRTHEGDDDEDNPKSTAELREEIECLESEGRKLLDAFNGLELSALTKSRSAATGAALDAPADSKNQLRPSVYPEATSPSALGSAYTLIPDRTGFMHMRSPVPLVKQPVNLKRKPSVVDSIAGSLKAGTSVSDLHGNALQSIHSTPNLTESTAVPKLSVSHSDPSVPLNRRPSVRRGPGHSSSNGGPPQHTASATLAAPQRHHPNADPALLALETELADIRRRKANVSARYERRLEFLRAKLKAAEIRDRLAKK